MALDPKERYGLTTGEVSKMFGMSTSLVERLFRNEIIAGWEHPSTGELMIDPKSIEALPTLKQNITAGPQKKGQDSGG